MTDFLTMSIEEKKEIKDLYNLDIEKELNQLRNLKRNLKEKNIELSYIKSLFEMKSIIFNIENVIVYLELRNYFKDSEIEKLLNKKDFEIIKILKEDNHSFNYENINKFSTDIDFYKCIPTM